MEDLARRLKALDAYPKVNEDFFTRTFSGGVITVLASLAMGLLFLSELRASGAPRETADRSAVYPVTVVHASNKVVTCSNKIFRNFSRAQGPSPWHGLHLAHQL